jgi:hypothetical protein
MNDADPVVDLADTEPVNRDALQPPRSNPFQQSYSLFQIQLEIIQPQIEIE